MIWHLGDAFVTQQVEDAIKEDALKFESDQVSMGSHDLASEIQLARSVFRAVARLKLDLEKEHDLVCMILPEGLLRFILNECLQLSNDVLILLEIHGFPEINLELLIHRFKHDQALAFL